MISKRLVAIIYNVLLDPWECGLSNDANDMVKALDDAIGFNGYIDGIYFLKADHKVWSGNKGPFPEFMTCVNIEVRGKETAICIGEIVGLDIEKGFAKLMISNHGKVHYIILPTDAEDRKMSRVLLNKRGYVMR